MAQRSMAHVVGLGDNDPLFARIRVEAEDAARNDPVLAAFSTPRSSVTGRWKTRSVTYSPTGCTIPTRRAP